MLNRLTDILLALTKQDPTKDYSLWSGKVCLQQLRGVFILFCLSQCPKDPLSLSAQAVDEKSPPSNVVSFGKSQGINSFQKFQANVPKAPGVRQAVLKTEEVVVD